MGANQETSHTLRPEDTESKILNIIVFIFYRILHIGCLSFSIYKMNIELVLDVPQFIKLLLIFTVVEILVLCGMIYGRNRDYIRLEESSSQQARLNTLNSNIETWAKGNGPSLRRLRLLQSEKKYIQCEKEEFAAYLTGSRQRIPRPFPVNEARYQMTIFFVYAYLVLRLACADILPAFAQWSIILLLLHTSFLCGRQGGWYVMMGHELRKIRKECESNDVEKWEDTQKQLEWWIEAILKEESDSDALVEERMEVIVEYRCPKAESENQVVKGIAILGYSGRQKRNSVTGGR
jgi:hypothetical protein